jgi:SAM-dependent methyltransferase
LSTPNVEIRGGQIQAASSDDRFDSAVVINVLEHIEADETALAEIREVLHPGGHLLVWVPAHPRLYSDFDRRIGHFRRYRKQSLSQLVSAAGFELVEARYVNALGALAWWVLATKAGRTPTTSGLVSTYDRFAIPLLRKLETRVRPPFGQSLFCAAQRI